MIDNEPETGPFLAALAGTIPAEDRLALAPAVDVTRTAFKTESPAPFTLAEHGWAMSEPGFRSYRAPEMVACRLADVVLLGADGVVLQGGKVIPDTLHHVTTWAADSLVESFVPGSRMRLRAEVEAAESPAGPDHLIGFTPAWRNYAHWMQECLPKLAAFLELRQRVAGLVLVMPSLSPRSFQQQTLDLLGIRAEEVLTVNSGMPLRFRHAWVASQADIWSVPPFLRRIADDLVESVLATRPRGGAERIYLHREEGPRLVDNFRGVRAVVEHAGFHVVSPERLSVAEQVALMAGARFVIGEHGAGLANIVFCRTGCTVLELFNPASVQPEYWSLASACGLSYGFLVGTHPPARKDEAADWNSDYVVPLDRLQEAIASLTTPARSAPSIRFDGPHGFELAGLGFTLASAGSGELGRVLIAKDRPFIESYAETLPPLAPRRIFEFGIYRGGSALFLTALLQPERFVCLDIAPPPDGFAEAIGAAGMTGTIRPYFGIPQDDADRVRNILEEEFADAPPDLIIDDASHLYGETKQSFQIAFPYLKPGGCYIIEDWSWAHWPENQDPAHGWSDRPAMSNLILELVLLLPSSDLIARMEIRQGYVMIWKQAAARRRPLLNIDGTLRLRGRRLGPV